MDYYDHQILRLTKNFYNDYPNPPFTELLSKDGRQYNCLLFQSHYGYYICVPFRSNIPHQYCYNFKKSKRTKRGRRRSGLDYTKIILVDGLDKDNYVGVKQALIDRDEYIELRNNMTKIANEAMRFVDDYVEYMLNGDNRICDEEFFRRYNMSTLKYFHNILGLK